MMMMLLLGRIGSVYGTIGAAQMIAVDVGTVKDVFRAHPSLPFTPAAIPKPEHLLSRTTRCMVTGTVMSRTRRHVEQAEDDKFEVDDAFMSSHRVIELCWL